MPQVHDFYVGNYRCSVVIGKGSDEIEWVYVGDTALTGDQWRELVQRVIETDWTEE